MSFPTVARVKQSVPQPRVGDIAGTVRRLILESRIRERVPAGGTIAVGVGSRGITAIPTVAKATVDTLKEMGFKPFIVAAMGSHGGATRRRPARAAGRLRDHARGDGRRGPDRHGHRRPRDQPRRPADLLRQERPRGRRNRPAQPRQAPHRLQRDLRVGRSQDAGHRPGQARRGDPDPQARHPRDAQGPAGRR